MADVLSDLFHWAGTQPANATVVVEIDIAGNDMSRNNLVSYAHGELKYHRGSGARPATFASDPDTVTQYFSDRRFGTRDPFDPSQTDPLTVTITPLTVIRPGSSPYSITLHSSKWRTTDTISPKFDDATGIIFGHIHKAFITISLCNRQVIDHPR